jgi:hypothetical protein
MIADDKTPAPVSPSKQRARRLRIAGVIVLALGIAGAGVVYWLGTRSPDVSGDISMTGYNKSERRQMAILYGKQGQLIEDWSDDLQQPGTQAVIISIVSIFVASGCFYFARLSNLDD